MRTGQGSILQSLRAVQAFLDANGVRLGPVISTGARKKLDEAVSQLDLHAAMQTGSFLEAKGSTQRQRSLRRVLLRDHMTPIARIAAAEIPASPEGKPFRMPKGRPSAEQLAAAAQGMADAAAKFSQTFTAAGLPDDFVDRLTAAADAMLDALGDRMQSRGQRSGATRGLKVKLSQGRKIVGILDAFVVSALKDDPSLLAEWNVVKRVQLLPGRAPASAPKGPVQGTDPLDTAA